MNTSILDKTEKGREEIATRQHHLAPRLRTLLVLVDGKHTGDELLKKLTGLGLNEKSLTELIDNGFVHAVTAPQPASAPQAAAHAPVTSVAPAEPVADDKAENLLPEGQSQFEAIYHFYTETIRSTIGLRGYGLQLKVEKAASIEDFRELRQAYLEAVLKAKGNEMARSLRNRLDQLLYLGDAPPSTTIVGEQH
jgi:ribosomal protein L12E/L44/L45/RPP1/RPP2